MPIPEFQLAQAQFAVIGDGASEKALDSAREFARSGKIVLVPLTSASAGITVAQLLGIPEFSAPEADVKDYALFAQIDFQHPFFASFADPRFSDFTKIHFWKYRKMETASLAGARVPARFENGDPAIVQVPLGKGSVVIFASSWRPVDSQLALSSKFVPLLQTLLEQSSMLPVQKAQYFVGDEIALSVVAQPLSVKKPDGSTVEVAAGAKFTGADQPGVYSVEPGGRRFVVNLLPEESRTTPLAPERLEGFGVPLNREAAASPRRARGSLRRPRPRKSRAGKSSGVGSSWPP